MKGGVRIERIEAPRCTVGESPLWVVAEQAWYWVDIVERTIWRWNPASGAIANWNTPQMVACLAARSGGGLVAGMQSGLFALGLGDAGLLRAAVLARPVGIEEGMRFNDGRCDRQGRFWSGTMVMDMAQGRAEGKLYRLDAAALEGPFVSGLMVQNGLAFAPDGRTMYLSDSHPQVQKIWAFDYDPDSGEPSRQRLFVDMLDHPGRPDGAAVDADGCYWICGNDAGCILRFTPDGRLDRRIDVPMAKPSMCSFGGPALDTMLVTSISAGQSPDDAWAGATIAFRPGVQGLPEVPCVA
ncbi:SMP-30/gluconolactonase/LRE family protein [Massilia sp. TSP1-1-2]|uniref:SMP-30/gluconolactonase/LRE family protein n=1 Tax=unclassified Massilia TaxID=2609279 RepID=UPI003CEB4AB2